MTHSPQQHPRLTHASTQEDQEGEVDEGGENGSPHCTQLQPNEGLGGGQCDLYLATTLYY